MIIRQPVFDDLPPPRSRLQRAMARLEAEIDGTSRARRDDIKEMCAWLAERTFRGRAEPARDERWTAVAGWVDRVEAPPERREWCAFIMAVLSAAGQEILYFEGGEQMDRHPDVLSAMFAERSLWRRGAAAWKPAPTAECDHIYMDLARHLFVEWPMPGFMDSAWMHRQWDKAWKRELYVHMAAGRSLRDAPLPYRMTRKQAHAFPTAPADNSIESALAWADCVSLDAGAALAGELSRTRLGEGSLMTPGRRDYWLSVVRYFAGHPEFAREHAGEIVDYLSARLEGGARSGLKLHGRNPDDLLREVRAWHGSLGRGRRTNRLDATPYPEPPMAPFELAAGEATYRIRRITNALELREEGAAMSNCVLLYHVPCVAGRCSIWSLEEERADAIVRRVATIREQDRVVVEAKRRANRPVSADERRIIKMWADREGLGARF